MKKYLSRFDALEVEIIKPNMDTTLFRLYTEKPRHEGFAESKHSTIAVMTSGGSQRDGLTIPISDNAFAVISPYSDHWGTGKIVIEVDQDTPQDRHLCPVCGYSANFAVVLSRTATMLSDGSLYHVEPREAELRQSSLTTCPCGFSGEKREFQNGNWRLANPDDWAQATRQKCLHFILVFLEERPDHNNIIGHVLLEARAADDAIIEAEQIILSEPRKAVTFGLHSLSRESSIKTWEF